MMKFELVELIVFKQSQLFVKDVELVVKIIIEYMFQLFVDG